MRGASVREASASADGATGLSPVPFTIQHGWRRIASKGLF